MPSPQLLVMIRFKCSYAANLNPKITYEIHPILTTIFAVRTIPQKGKL